ncbi:MAG: nucleotidyltransferase family protein [Candidatus Omnitrophica bacterium]|nr:nucleotidyltransferase family protein [Candidatus Omnitrophota bacterium]
MRPSRGGLENELILLSCRLNPDKHVQDRIRGLLKQPLDWPEIIALCGRHKVSPLLYYNLNKLGAGGMLKDAAWSNIRNYYYANINRNILFQKNLCFILEKLNEAGLEVIVLKGALFIEEVYRNPGLRALSDIDMLVKKNDITAVKGVLFQNGYKEVPFSGRPDTRNDAAFEVTKEIENNLNLGLDVHEEFVPARPYRIDLPDLWDRTREKVINGTKLSFPSWEDTIIYCALHIRKHPRPNTLHLKFIVDIDAILRSSGLDLDWGYIEAAAKKSAFIHSVYFALYIAKELFGTYIPADVMNRFRPRAVKEKAIRLCMNKNNFLKAAGWQGMALRLLLFDRGVDFIIYLWRVSFLERFIMGKISALSSILARNR